MFTGIVEELGSVVSLEGGRLRIAATRVLEDVELGASIAVNGSTAVSPRENGSGCTIFGISVIRTVSAPWLIATFAIFTSWPITMVPVRSSTTTLAGVSELTAMFSSSAKKRAVEMPSGFWIVTVRASCSAATRPNRGGWPWRATASPSSDRRGPGARASPSSSCGSKPAGSACPTSGVM